MDAKKKTVTALVEVLKSALKKDRNHKYRLNKPLVLPRLLEPVPDYADDLLAISDSIITILPNEECDGATLAPDKLGRWSFVVPSIVHDAIYSRLEPIAAAWGWPVAKVRKWADKVFYGVSLHYVPKPLALIYYGGVRAFGGLAHKMGKLTALALLCGVLAVGCGGCATPADPFGGAEQPEADYTLMQK